MLCMLLRMQLSYVDGLRQVIQQHSLLTFLLSLNNFSKCLSALGQARGFFANSSQEIQIILHLDNISNHVSNFKLEDALRVRLKYVLISNCKSYTGSNKFVILYHARRSITLRTTTSTALAEPVHRWTNPSALSIPCIAAYCLRRRLYKQLQ